MAVRIVTLSIDKVQTFLFDTISEHTQKSQMNSGTLQNIISSSRIISEDLFRMIGVEGNDGFFSGMVKEILLKCSGVCIFSTDLEERQIKESLRKTLERRPDLLDKYEPNEEELKMLQLLRENVQDVVE